MIRNERELIAENAKSWKHNLKTYLVGDPDDLMYQNIILLMDCFINGINNNKKRAQCLMKKIKKIMNEKMEDYFERFSENDDDYIWMQGKEGCSDITVKIKKEDSKYLENEMKEDGFEVTIGNDFCYKSIMDNMKTVHDKLEMYYDYL